MNHKRMCPVCGSPNHSLLFRQQFATLSGVALLKGYDVAACDGCGFTFAQGLPDQAAFDSYYKEVSKYENPDQTLSSAMAERFEESLSFMLLVTGLKEKSFLKLSFADIGCATGNFLRFLKEKGAQDITGIDPSRACVDFLNGNNIRAFQSSVFHMDNKIKYDFIRFNAVLEHIEDVNQAIESLKGKLSPNGYLYISVPEVRGFEHLNQCPFQEFSVEHINYFSANSLRQLMARHGLNAVKQGEKVNINPWYSELEMVFRQDSRCGGIEAGFDSASIDGLKTYIFNNESLEAEVNRKIKVLAESREPILVWGVGTFTLRQLACGPLRDCNITGLVDCNPHYWGKEYRGIPVLKPVEVPGHEEGILVSSSYAQESICSYIRNSLKAENRLITIF